MAVETMPAQGASTPPLAAILAGSAMVLVVGFVAIFGGAISGDSGGATGQYADAGTIPGAYVGAILSAGQTCATLSPGLLAAQLKQESGFRPGARSPVGALGIAQFMPGTWASHGKDGDGDGRADILNPADAIPSAAAYDCSVAAAVADVPGDPVRLMLAAYNAGPGAVRAYQGVPPFPETQSYVESILAAVPGMTAALSSASAPIGPATEAAAAAVAFARGELGDPYVLGANGPDAWDCSSLVQAAYAAAGVRLPRTTYDQVDASGPSIALMPLSAWRPGDLLFAAGSDGTPSNPGHVGIYLGGNQVLHAPHTGDVVKIVTLDRYEKVTRVTRPSALSTE